MSTPKATGMEDIIPHFKEVREQAQREANKRRGLNPHPMSTPTPPWAETHAPFTDYAAYELNALGEEEYIPEYQSAAQRVQWMHNTLMALHRAKHAKPYDQEAMQGYIKAYEEIDAYAAHHNR